MQFKPVELLILGAVVGFFTVSLVVPTSGTTSATAAEEPSQEMEIPFHDYSEDAMFV